MTKVNFESFAGRRENVYWTKVKTLHMYSSQKLALILFFRNKMKSYMKISFFFGVHWLETHVQRKW